jgi:hypothetical protein
MAYISVNVDVNIDIDDYMDEIKTSDLLKALKNRKTNTKDIVTDIEKLKLIAEILDVRHYTDKDIMVKELKQLY